MNIQKFFREFRGFSPQMDLPASLAVFLVAVPLCLGIAHASKAPLLSGLIAGAIGGIVIGILSKSPLSVSGPAAGLTAIIAAEAMKLQQFEALLTAIVLAGLIQIGLGLLKAGAIGTFIPSSVIKGMLAAIGVILILKQLPHLMGYDREAEGVIHFQVQPEEVVAEGSRLIAQVAPQKQGHFDTTTFSLLGEALRNIDWEIFLIGLVSLAVLLLWDKTMGKKIKTLPSSLIAVLVGTILALIVQKLLPQGSISPNHLVQIPEMKSASDFVAQTHFPLWSILSQFQVYSSALTIALVASIESLLSIEAIDKLDPHKRRTPVNRELIAQGCGNTMSGLIGGLPVTSVIVRSSVNLMAGAQSKYSAILHGVWILMALFLAADLINLIPLTTLSAILIVTGYKLANPKTIIAVWKQGKDQFIPFILTLTMIVVSDLLLGVTVGLFCSSLFILYNHYRSQVLKIVEKEDGLHLIFSENLTFLNKATIIDQLEALPDNTKVMLNISRCIFIDHDIVEAIEEFAISGRERGIILYATQPGESEVQALTPERIKKLEILSHAQLMPRKHFH